MVTADAASGESRVHLDAVGTERRFAKRADVPSGVLPWLLRGALTGLLPRLLFARILLLLSRIARAALSGLLLARVLLLLTRIGRLIAGLVGVLGLLVCHVTASLVHRSKGAPKPAWTLVRPTPVVSNAVPS